METLQLSILYWVVIVIIYLALGIVYTFIWDRIAEESPFETKGERGAAVMAWLFLFVCWTVGKAFVFAAQFIGQVAEAFAPTR